MFPCSAWGQGSGFAYRGLSPGRLKTLVLVGSSYEVMMSEECKSLGLIDRSRLRKVSQETAKELAHPCPNSQFLPGPAVQDYGLRHWGV